MARVLLHYWEGVQWGGGGGNAKGMATVLGVSAVATKSGTGDPPSVL